MSLSESVLQSQIALNQNHIKYLSLDVENFYYEMAHDIAHYKYYSGLKVDKEHAKAIKTSHYKIINAWKREIAKYAKLQKALKAELKEVREHKKMIARWSSFFEQQREDWKGLMKAKHGEDWESILEAKLEAEGGDFIIR